MKSLIIGAGEVGRSLYKVLKATYKKDVRIRDIEIPKILFNNMAVLNICYPYSKGFVKNTKKYIEEYTPNVVIIHSTVPVGTTRECGDMCVHSPIHGKHPNLDKGILTFKKYIGGIKPKPRLLAKQYLKNAGMSVKVVKSPEVSELSKILCTTYYGWNIVFAKEVASICEELGVPFEEVYTEWNKEYNKGYTKLGMEQFVRPILEPTKGLIGGHCIVNNSKLLDSFVTNLIKERDKTY